MKRVVTNFAGRCQWHHFLTIVVSIVWGSVAWGQEKDKAAAQREEIVKRMADKVEIRFDQPYAETTNRFQMVDLYLPKQRATDKPLPVVVFIHGGGWTGGDRKGYVQMASSLASSGKFVAAAVGYRLSQEAKWPAQIHDCKAAIRWLKGHAKEFNIDPERIGATGSSAGGHLVTMLAVTGGVPELEGTLGKFGSESSRIRCAVNFCGPSDLTTPLMQGEAALKDDPAVAGLIGGTLAAKMDAAKSASPLTHITADDSPVMTVHGTNDSRVNFSNAEKLDAALKKAKVVSLMVPMTNAGHGIPLVPELAERIQKFWDWQLRDEKAEISTEPILVPAPPAKK